MSLIKHESWVSLLRYRALNEPTELAFGFMLNEIDDEIKYSYESLDAAARKIGAALQQADMSGERAVLLYQPGPDYVCALMGCLYAGVIAVPLYAPRPNGSYDRIIQVIKSARASVLMSTERILATLDQAEWATLKQVGLHWMSTDTLPEALLDQWQMPDIDNDSLAILQFTSGSTGHPKGVMLCHRHLLTNSRMIARGMALSRESVGVAWLPPYHDMGLIGALLQPIYTGFPVHLMSPATFLQRPIRWLEAISKYRGTLSAAPNFAYELCSKRVRPEQLETLDLSSWKVAGNGAEPIRAETLRQFSSTFAPAGFDPRAFFPCFGMAEATLFLSGGPHLSGVRTLDVSRHELAKGIVIPVEKNGPRTELVSSGIVDPEVDIRIVNPIDGQPCKCNEVGEIWVSGETVAAGYWDHPKETEETFFAQLPDSESKNWMRTGDLGCLVDGELYVTGRMKDLIIINGQNHYPHDIEETISGIHPALRPQGAAAFSIDSADGEKIGLVLELERGYTDIDLGPLAAIVHDAVSRKHQLQIHKLAFVRPGGIPKTSSGKIQRFLTRERLLEGNLKLIEENRKVEICL